MTTKPPVDSPAPVEGQAVEVRSRSQWGAVAELSDSRCASPACAGSHRADEIAGQVDVGSPHPQRHGATATPASLLAIILRLRSPFRMHIPRLLFLLLSLPPLPPPGFPGVLLSFVLSSCKNLMRQKPKEKGLPHSHSSSSSSSSSASSTSGSEPPSCSSSASAVVGVPIK